MPVVFYYSLMSPGYMCRAVLQHFLVGSPVADIPIIGTALACLLDAAVLSSDFALGSSIAKCRRRPRAPLIGTSARAASHSGQRLLLMRSFDSASLCSG